MGHLTSNVKEMKSCVWWVLVIGPALRQRQNWVPPRPFQRFVNDTDINLSKQSFIKLHKKPVSQVNTLLWTTRYNISLKNKLRFGKLTHIYLFFLSLRTIIIISTMISSIYLFNTFKIKQNCFIKQYLLEKHWQLIKSFCCLRLPVGNSDHTDHHGNVGNYKPVCSIVCLLTEAIYTKLVALTTKLIFIILLVNSLVVSYSRRMNYLL